MLEERYHSYQRKRSLFKDTQNKKYIDFVGSYGPAILGHSNHAVTGAIKKQVEKGLCFGAPSVLEIELADLIIDAIDSIEKGDSQFRYRGCPHRNSTSKRFYE